MRKIILVLCCFTIFALGLYAEETGDFEDPGIPAYNPRFALGAGFTYVSNAELFGGHFEFGFIFFRKILYIQNNLILRAGGLTADAQDSSLFTLSEKIIFGRFIEDAMKIYTYLEGGAGVYGNSGKGFFEGDPAYSFGFGGGVELGSENFGSWYVETGYLGQKISLKYPVSGVIVQTGWRIFF